MVLKLYLTLNYNCSNKKNVSVSAGSLWRIIQPVVDCKQKNFWRRPKKMYYFTLLFIDSLSLSLSLSLFLSEF